MTKRRNDNVHQLAAFAAGGLIGAGIALLLAPQSGSETRRSLSQLGRTAKQRSKRLGSDLNRKLDDFFVDMRDSLKSHVSSGKNWTEGKKGEVEQALQAGKQYIEKEMAKILRS
jgi:gas vesicle protein